MTVSLVEAASEIDAESARLIADRMQTDIRGCSAICKDGFLGRNFGIGGKDAAIVRSRSGNRESIGVSFGSGDMAEWLMADGINDSGFACSLSGIGWNDKGRSSGSALGKDRMNALTCVRFLLNNADSVGSAVRLLSEKDIYSAPGNPEVHFLMADGKDSVALEFIGGRMTAIYDAEYLTDFHISGFETETDLPNHPVGLERYRILLEEEPIPELLRRTAYSNSAGGRDSPWISECYGDYSPAGLGDFGMRTPMKEWMLDMADRLLSSPGKTSHTSIYDLRKKELRICAAESWDWSVFSI